MLSPAARHRQEMLARQAASNAPSGLAGQRPETGHAATAYELLLAQLGEHISQLRGIQSVEGKIALKAKLIETYDTHVDATLEAAGDTGKAVQDEIVATMMIWRFDIGDFTRGLDLADHVLHFGLDLPQNIKRQAPTLIAEEVAEAALIADKLAKPFDLDILNRAIALTEKADMPDQVRAKLFKARGRLLLRMADKVGKDASAPAGAERAALSGALDCLQRALKLDKHSGVKKDIERLEAKLRAAPQEQQS